MEKLLKFMVLFLILLLNKGVSGQNLARPFIWVKAKNKAEILLKIENQAWAKAYYKAFTARLNEDISLYRESPNAFLKKIPFDWDKQISGKTPPLKTFTVINDLNYSERNLYSKYLQIAIDCGVLYFLTEEETYAQCGLDILHAFVEGLMQIKPSQSTGNGGWMYPEDHLREARIIGAQIPIVYDFIAPYLKNNIAVHDIGKNGDGVFSKERTQRVFLTYAQLAAEHGHTGSNWSVLESYSLVQNALAIDDLNLRNKYLDYYLVKGTDRQDALPDIANNYKQDGDVYPETSQYSNGVASYTTQLMFILDNYDPTLKLGETYYKIPFSLDRWNSIRYPNEEIIRFGDGKRKYKTPYRLYDMAYLVGRKSSIPILTDKFGPLITKAIGRGKYDRALIGNRSESVRVYLTPMEFLWLEETKKYKWKDQKLPRTDQFSHAGVFLQRNLNSEKDPAYGLMSFVGGGHMVHGHASGMDMELYGLGEVMGVDHGRGPYKTDLHENYSRLYAAHNTVIVNGESQGEGGWVNLGINSTELVTMEPKPLEEAISPNYSFTRTTFLDDKGDKAEAKQERTMALIRTSPTSGYYVDVFRSDSELQEEYHDYIYHNIGDNLFFANEDLVLKQDEDRFSANANAEHKYNKKYKNPGWHFFSEIESSGIYTQNVRAKFELKKIDTKERFMNLFILGNHERAYTMAMAPKTFEAPAPYNNMLTPTLVIRQKGEAWTNPFAVIYEPTFEKNNALNGIQSVTKLDSDGLFKGFKVVSKIGPREITQYIISQAKNSRYENTELDLIFEGAFMILTLDEKLELLDIYIGEGKNLNYNNIEIKSKSNQSIKGYFNFRNGKKSFNYSDNTTFNFSEKN